MIWGLVTAWALLSVLVWVDVLVWGGATLRAVPVIGYPAGLIGGAGPLLAGYFGLASLAVR